MKKLLAIAIICLITTSCAIVPVRADDSAIKAVEAKNLSLELYILQNSINEKAEKIKPVIDEINKLKKQYDEKRKQLDILLGKPEMKKEAK